MSYSVHGVLVPVKLIDFSNEMWITLNTVQLKKIRVCTDGNNYLVYRHVVPIIWCLSLVAAYDHKCSELINRVLNVIVVEAKCTI